MRKFDTKVQLLKYRVLKEVARLSWNNELYENLLDIPQTIVPGKVPTMRCCVFKERAIVQERVKIALGGDKNNPNVIEVIETACDGCPTSGYNVTDQCRGCLAHKCEAACKKGAIEFDKNHVAHINKDLCVDCGMCAKACPFQAIQNYKRPCQTACKVKAISMNEDKTACINNDKCTSCGACVTACPFGAITSKSFILKVIDAIQRSNNGKNFNVYAIIAPAMAAQFNYAKFGQAITGLKELGFTHVLETAFGADLVAYEETEELKEKGFLTSSCCPAFVKYINIYYPQLKEYISHNPSPMARLGKFIKDKDPKAKVIFIGPCTAKKAEFQLESVKPYIDAVITFEELQALYDSKDIDITTLPETILDNASFFGRSFAVSGGLAGAVKEVLKEQGSDFEVKPCICSGIDECKIALLKKSKNLLDANFIEGMACVGGCVGGAGCLTHFDKDRDVVLKHGGESDLTILTSIEKDN